MFKSLEKFLSERNEENKKISESIDNISLVLNNNKEVISLEQVIDNLYARKQEVETELKQCEGSLKALENEQKNVMNELQTLVVSLENNDKKQKDLVARISKLNAGIVDKLKLHDELIETLASKLESLVT